MSNSWAMLIGLWSGCIFAVISHMYMRTLSVKGKMRFRYISWSIIVIIGLYLFRNEILLVFQIMLDSFESYRKMVWLF